MQEHVVKIKAYLDDYRRKGFTGGIKMAFEKGTPKTFWRSTNPEFEINPLKDDFSIEKMLGMATAGTFSGTLLFMFDDGDIKKFDYIETHQGRELLEILDNYHLKAGALRSPEKRPAIVIRKKAGVQ
jgi:hypothetical protein